MINLLSPVDKRELRAARRNVALLRYNFVILGLILVVGFVYAGSFFITFQNKMNAEAQLDEDTARTIAYTKVRSQAEQFSKNLKTAKTILSNEVTYSALIVDIAKTLPSGAVLSSLSLDPTKFGQSLEINAGARSYDKALELKKVLEDSPLFSDVSLVSVNSTGSDAGPSAYPLIVGLKAKLATAAEVKAIKDKQQ